MPVIPAGMRWSDLHAVSNMGAVKGGGPVRDAFKRRLALTLREARRQSGLIQEAVAAEMGIDNDTVSRWETGNREIRVYDLSRLASLYRVAGDLFLNPPDRIDDVPGAVRRARSLRAAQEAAAAEMAAATGQPDAEGGPSPRGRRPS